MLPQVAFERGKGDSLVDDMRKVLSSFIDECKKAREVLQGIVALIPRTNKEVEEKRED